MHSGAEVLSRLVTQVCNPVRWDLCMETLADMGVTGIVELLPGGTLTGLAKRGLRGVESVALKTPDDLEKARALVAAHGSPNPLADAPTSKLLIAPVSGTIRVGDAPAGASLKPGSTVGAVCTRRGEEVAISAPHGGTVAEWLVADGDPVAPGQPLVRLHPEGAHA